MNKNFFKSNTTYEKSSISFFYIKKRSVKYDKPEQGKQKQGQPEQQPE